MITYILQYSAGNGVWQNYINRYGNAIELLSLADAEQIAKDHKMGNALWQAKSSKGTTFAINFRVNG